MAPKRNADWDAVDLTGSPAPPAPSKRQCVSASSSNFHSKPKHKACYPATKYKPHRDSGVGKNFHGVPYPLTLLPKKSWKSLINGDADAKIICSQCGKERATSAHQRKLFLVAERLSWELGTVSRKQREQNEISTWAVNAELDIFEPVVEEEDFVLGGRKSMKNEWYPFRAKEEAEMAMKVVEKADILTEQSWRLWKETISTQVQRVRDENRKPETGQRRTLDQLGPNSELSPRRSPRKQGKAPIHASSSLPTPPSSAFDDDLGTKTAPPLCSYQSLQNFYSLLDQIERTSPMGSQYLEAYAEQLHKDGCSDCWFKNIIVELPNGPEDEKENKDEESPQVRKPIESSRRTMPSTQPSPRQQPKTLYNSQPPVR